MKDEKLFRKYQGIGLTNDRVEENFKKVVGEMWIKIWPFLFLIAVPYIVCIIITILNYVRNVNIKKKKCCHCLGNVAMGFIIKDVDVYPKREELEAFQYRPNKCARCVLVVIGETVMFLAAIFLIYALMEYWGNNVELTPIRMPVTLEKYVTKTISPIWTIYLDEILEPGETMDIYWNFYKKQGSKYEEISSNACPYMYIDMPWFSVVSGGIDVGYYDTEILGVIYWGINSTERKYLGYEGKSVCMEISTRGFVPFKGGEDLYTVKDLMPILKFQAEGNVYGYNITFNSTDIRNYLVTECQLVGARSVVINPKEDWSFIEQLLSLFIDPRDPYIPEEEYIGLYYIHEDSKPFCADIDTKVPGNCTTSTTATFIPEYGNHYFTNNKTDVIDKLLKDVTDYGGNSLILYNGTYVKAFTKDELYNMTTIASIKIHKAVEQWDYNLTLKRSVESIFTFYFKTVFVAALGIAVWAIRFILNMTLFKKRNYTEVNQDMPIIRE